MRSLFASNNSSALLRLTNMIREHYPDLSACKNLYDLTKLFTIAEPRNPRRLTIFMFVAQKRWSTDFEGLVGHLCDIFVRDVTLMLSLLRSRLSFFSCSDFLFCKFVTNVSAAIAAYCKQHVEQTQGKPFKRFFLSEMVGFLSQEMCGQIFMVR